MNEPILIGQSSAGRPRNVAHLELLRKALEKRDSSVDLPRASLPHPGVKKCSAKGKAFWEVGIPKTCIDLGLVGDLKYVRYHTFHEAVYVRDYLLSLLPEDKLNPVFTLIQPDAWKDCPLAQKQFKKDIEVEAVLDAQELRNSDAVIEKDNANENIHKINDIVNDLKKKKERESLLKGKIPAVTKRLPESLERATTARLGSINPAFDEFTPLAKHNKTAKEKPKIRTQKFNSPWDDEIYEMSFYERAMNYEQNVLEGHIPVPLLVKKAIERNVEDLKNQKTKHFPYYFDPEAGSKICRFIELMPHINGYWPTEENKIRLEPWQCWMFMTAYGWLETTPVASNELPFRRFREMMLMCPRKQGKSTKLSAISNFHLIGDGETGHEIWMMASDGKQAKACFTPAAGMARMIEKQTAYRYKITDSTHQSMIKCEDTGGRISTITKDIGANKDGLNAHLVIFDETHAYQNFEAYETIREATTSKPSSVQWTITTAGYFMDSVAYAQYQRAREVLLGKIRSETEFYLIYTAEDEPEDKLYDIETLMKVSPNYGISLPAEQAMLYVKQAKEDPRKRGAFFTKRLCRWVAGGMPWIQAEEYDDCIDDSLTYEWFKGKRVHVGLDMSSISDLCAMAITHQAGGVWFTYIKYFYPEGSLAENSKAIINRSQIRAWKEEGHITIQSGNTIDDKHILKILEEVIQDCEVMSIGGDSFHSLEKAVNEDWPSIPYAVVPQGYRLNVHMQTLADRISNQKMKFNDNPINRWCFTNLNAKTNQVEEVMPTKPGGMQRSPQKIDGASATLHSIHWLVENSGREEKENTFLSTAEALRIMHQKQAKEREKAQEAA